MKSIFLFFPFLACAVAPVSAASRPNIVVIVSDDHRADYLGYFGHPDLKTPNLDCLAEQGVVFRHAYVSASDRSSVCTPARTQFHSGRGLYHWTPKQAAEQEPAGYSLGRAFRAAGYATLRTGKGINVPSPLNAEFERNVEDSTLPLQTHLANGLAFIREHAGRQPFLLVLEPRVPHSPYPSTDIFRALYSPAKLKLPPEFLEKHPFLDLAAERFPTTTSAGKREKTAPSGPLGWTEAQARETLAQYYASISFLDNGAGQVLAALRDTGVSDATFIVFLGDNGFSISHHGLFGKSDVYENGGLHVPLIIAGPGLTHRESPAFAYMIDVFPTLCELAGVSIPSRVEGHSLGPILRGASTQVRDVAFTVFRDEQFALRDARWKLILFPTYRRTQFFDLTADPRELRDLSADPVHAARIADFTARIEREKVAVGYVWPPAGVLPQERRE